MTKTITSPDYLFITGPCALESWEQMASFIPLFRTHGLTYIRAQLFKPRTSPDTFQGIGPAGLEIIKRLKDQYEFKFVSEACSFEQLQVVADFASIVQIGARNMQNFELLKMTGRVLENSSQAKLGHFPLVILKRGFSNTLSEWLSAADYLLRSGVPAEKIVLCERGTRNAASPKLVALDFGIALKAKLNSPYKVIIDPSHGSGDRELVLPLAKGIMAMPFDGLMIESHPVPDKSVSDAHQAISLESLNSFLASIHG